MAKSKKVLCPSCGFACDLSQVRCVSCGAKLEQLGPVVRSREEEIERRHQQEGFSIVWMLIALVISGVLTAAVVVGIPMVVPALDFEGVYGMYICVPVWFVGGLLVGLISPGKAFIEPVVATLIVAVPTVIYLVQTQTVRTMPSFMYIIVGCVGVLFALVGAYMGDRIQVGPLPKGVE